MPLQAGGCLLPHNLLVVPYLDPLEGQGTDQDGGGVGRGIWTGF
jgi:hypothetical protein